MKFPFSIRKKGKTEMTHREITAQFREINARFFRIEESIERQNAKLPQISIQNVHIHQPILKSLEFRLDGLDIENLSGSLNLGNNIGVKTGLERIPGHENNSRKPEEPGTPIFGSKAANEASSSQQSAPLEPGLHRTPFGFRLKRN
jgi:hypothetical protein